MYFRGRKLIMTNEKTLTGRREDMSIVSCAMTNGPRWLIPYDSFSLERERVPLYTYMYI